MLTLYHSPGSSSMAAHIALHEVGAAFESRVISFARKEHQSPDFLAVNPDGTVPTLLIDGRRLTEVAAILFYLARRFPQTDLLPADDVEAEAQAISWMSFIAPARRRARQRRVCACRSTTGPTRLGARTLLDRRYPSLPPVLALCAFPPPRCGDVPQSRRPL
jgi:glutathione S-transferase